MDLTRKDHLVLCKATPTKDAPAMVLTYISYSGKAAVLPGAAFLLLSGDELRLLGIEKARLVQSVIGLN